MAQEERSANITNAQMKRMYGCGPGTSDQPQDKSSGGLTGRRIRRERRSAAQEERRASGKEHQRTCTTAHLCRRRRRKQHEGQDPLAAGWSAFVIKQMETAGIVGNLQTSLSNSMLKCAKNVSKSGKKVTNMCPKLGLLQRVTGASLRSGFYIWTFEL